VKGTDRIVLLSLVIVGLLAAFYFMILAPKRQEASKLGDEVTQLQTSIDEQNQVAQFAEQAREDFPRYYSRLVVLGKAVPDEADSASMLVQLSGIAARTGVDFRGLSLGEGSSAGSSTTSGSASAATTTPTTPASGTSTTGTSGTATTSSSGTAATATGTTATTTTPSAAPTGDSATSGSSTATSATTSTSTSPAPATEAAAATLPIGAAVGPAGLPALPYSLKFNGGFFDAADFMSGLDSLVRMRDGKVAANGRLLTVDGFTLSNPTLGAVPQLQVNFAVTSYMTPADQGLTGGATPGGPAQPQTTPVAQ
jgi:Tfp pilus assembly protein PilO